MNVVMIIPTGIGCEIGGHAGDATPSAKLLASVCENLIVHPNVINASDINESTENMLYVEGSILDRFLQGQIALEEVYSNRVLLAVNKPLKNETINSINAARNTIGSDIRIIELDTLLTLDGIFKPDGSASGIMTGADEAVLQIKLYKQSNPFDVLAIQTVVDVDEVTSKKYLTEGGVNPWGGAEALCSRHFSRELELQCAHAPYESGVLKTFNEIVDPRQAAELVSVSYIHCILKGLHKAPKVVEYNCRSKHTLRIDDIDVMVSPDGCWGHPHEACANWGIPIIFVKENRNIYKPFDIVPKGCSIVDNYMEASGMIASMKAGVHRDSVRRA
tara:strand:- start:36 stop:1031 length:996 start_codon:yes stop_codon:yes gene_type:complete